MGFMDECADMFSLPTLAKSRSLYVLVLSSILAGLSLIAFASLESSIVNEAKAQGFTGNEDDLLILDRRHGYEPDEVRRLLTTWGPGG